MKAQRLEITMTLDIKIEEVTKRLIHIRKNQHHSIKTLTINIKKNNLKSSLTIQRSQTWLKYNIFNF